MRAILLSGPDHPEVDGTQEFDVGLGQLGARIYIFRHCRLPARSRYGNRAHGFETTALTRTEVVQEVLGLYTGEAIKTRKPFRSGNILLHGFHAVEGQYAVCSEPDLTQHLKTGALDCPFTTNHRMRVWPKLQSSVAAMLGVS